MSTRTLVVLLACAASACGQELLARGTVETVTCTSGAAPTRTALADAAVSVHCAGIEEPVFGANTDARGQFTAVPPKSVPLTCSVEVTKPGYATRRYAVEDLCVSKFIGTAPGSADDAPSCAIFGVTASLEPEAKK